MNTRVLNFIAIALMVFIVAGCTATGGEQVKKSETAPAPTKEAPASKEAAEAPRFKVEQVQTKTATKPVVKKPSPPPEVKKISVEEMQRRRAMEATLKERIEGYWSLLKARNVNKAAEYIEEGRRPLIKGDLYGFISKNMINSYDVTATEIDFDGDHPKARVSGKLSAFPKGSVSPVRTDLAQTWMNIGGVWFIESTE